MYKLAHRVILLFIALRVANASRWWRDDGYDSLDDSPDPFPTHPPTPAYDQSISSGSLPLNATIGSAIYHLLAARQLAGCRLCPNPNPVCCNNGTFCCALGNSCQLEAGYCCPTGSTACPGAQNVCKTEIQTCCGAGVCSRGATCCGGNTCCSRPNVCTESGVCQAPGTANTSTSSTTSTSSSSTVGEGPTVIQNPPSSSETSTSIVVDPPASPPPTTTPTTTPDATTQTPSVSIPDSTQVVPFDATVSIDLSPSSFVDVPSVPVDLPPSTSADPVPSDTFATPLGSVPPAADAPPPTSSVVVETSTSNGVTLTLSHTVQPFIATASPTNTAQSAEDPSDAVALVYPWDPRIEYLPDGAWTSTTSSSTVGSCHNGTKVATQAGASIKFKFEGKQISALICNGSKGGDYSVQVDGSHGTDLSGYKDPGAQGDQCVISQPFNSGLITDGAHEINVIVKGSHAGSASGGTAVEFGGFIYRGSHAFGTTEDSKTNIPAIVGGTVGGVVGGILIIAIIVVVLVRRRRKRRNERVDDAPAVHTIPVAPPAGTPYSAVPTREYHDPYANSGYGPGHYPNPTASTSHTTSPAPAWRQTDAGPFGHGSYAAAAY